ncbi:MAG: patatin-like phospholipase family protein [bacterium]
MKRFIWIMLTLPLFTTGCFSKIQELPRLEHKSDFAAPDDRDELIGIAISGGGSRAATFASGALEALGEIGLQQNGKTLSLLDRVGYISSVSGGSLAAAYYAMRKPGKEVAILRGQELSAAYRSFFDRFQQDMQKDFEMSAFWRQLGQFRALNPTKNTYSFAEAWDAEFFGGQTFSNLYERERRGDSPRLILNGTSYNTGQRVALTTLPASEFEYDFVKTVTDDLATMDSGNREQSQSLANSLEIAQSHFRPLTFDALKADHHSLSISLAVATSASFPPVVGPVTYSVGGQPPYIHIGDGGLFDNLGTESLITVFLKKIPAGPSKKRGYIIVIDASYPFDAGKLDLDNQQKGFSVFKNDPSRIVSIMEERANTYQKMLWYSLRAEGKVIPDIKNLDIVILKHTDADWPNGYSELPEECRDQFKATATPQDIKNYVSRIPTLFRIKTPCDGALLIKSARKVVAKHRTQITEFLQGGSRGAVAENE